MKLSEDAQKMNETELKKGISGLVKSLVRRKGLHLVCPGNQSYFAALEFLLEELITKNKLKGIYVKLGKDYLVFHERLKTYGIDVSEMYFIYCDELEMERFFEASNCAFIPSPRSLTELSLSIATKMDNGKFDFLLLDSLKELLAYNKQDIAGKFVNYLLNKLRNSGTAGIIISPKDDAKSAKLTPILSKVCDTVVQ